MPGKMDAFTKVSFFLALLLLSSTLFLAFIFAFISMQAFVALLVSWLKLDVNCPVLKW